VRPAEQAREDVAAAREAWRAAAAAVPPERWVFVDECGVATNLVRRYGRAQGGARAPGAAPYGRWERLTIFGALSLGRALGACLAIEGAADTLATVAFVEHVLAPTLAPGQVVVMDNLSPHKAPRVRALIEAAGCTLLLLPPYSPDFNPIEQAWSKLKALLRALGARTTDALHAALTQVIDRITTTDAAGFFRHCGYARYEQ
jgi:transposase